MSYWNGQYFPSQYYGPNYWRESGVVPPPPPPIIIGGGGIARRRRRPAYLPTWLYELVLQYLTKRERESMIAKIQRDDDELMRLL